MTNWYTGCQYHEMTCYTLCTVLAHIVMDSTLHAYLRVRRRGGSEDVPPSLNVVNVVSHEPVDKTSNQFIVCLFYPMIGLPVFQDETCLPHSKVISGTALTQYASFTLLILHCYEQSDNLFISIPFPLADSSVVAWLLVKRRSRVV